MPDTSPPGVCLWLTGMSGSGKSTVTSALVPRLEARGHTVSVLDVVPVLAKQPGERTSEGKLLRKAFVAGEIAKHGGVAICVTVSARRDVRERARAMVGPERFLEILVEVPEQVAATRRASRGRRVPLRRRLRSSLRGIVAALGWRPSAGYQRPTAPDVTIDAVGQTPQEGADAILQVMHDRGFCHPAVRAVPAAPGPLEAVEA